MSYIYKSFTDLIFLFTFILQIICFNTSLYLTYFNKKLKFMNIKIRIFINIFNTEMIYRK